MAGEVMWFEFAGSDLEAMESFYGAMFGWQTTRMSGQDYAVTPPPARGIQGGLMKAPPGVRWTTVYVRVDDLEAKVAEAAARGGGVLLPPTTLADGMRVAVVTDPDGNPVGLSGGPAEASG
jgi:predicted enzyme related to lactoylglutathione lyase